MKYKPQIHNRRSVRLKEYDYSQEGHYFITICCNDRACLFGEIINGEMILNAYGNITYNEWLKTTEIRSNVELYVFVIMPNHIHGIVIIKNDDHRRGVLHTPGFIMNKTNLSTSSNSIMNECDNAKPDVLDTPGVVMTECENKSDALHARCSMTDECNPDELSVNNQGVCNTPLGKRTGVHRPYAIRPYVRRGNCSWI